MGEVVPTELINNREFISDCARFGEGLVTEKQIRKKYRFDAATWDRLSNDDTLIEMIELEKIRRIRSGQCAREKAQTHFVQAPDILNNIMQDGTASPRHKIESAKALGQIAAGPEAAPAAASAERFQITIIMGDETVVYDQPKILDNKPTTEDTAEQLSMDLIPFISSKKWGDGNGGNVL